MSVDLAQGGSGAGPADGGRDGPGVDANRAHMTRGDGSARRGAAGGVGDRRDVERELVEVAGRGDVRRVRGCMRRGCFGGIEGSGRLLGVGSVIAHFRVSVGWSSSETVSE